jgi:hypothetical protein
VDQTSIAGIAVAAPSRCNAHRSTLCQCACLPSARRSERTRPLWDTPLCVACTRRKI